MIFVVLNMFLGTNIINNENENENAIVDDTKNNTLHVYVSRKIKCKINIYLEHLVDKHQ